MSVNVYRYDFNTSKFRCPYCKTLYKKHTKFIKHVDNNCIAHKSFYSGQELNMILNKGGEEDVEIITE